MSVNTYLPGTPCAPLAFNITAISRAYPMVVTVDTTGSIDTYIVGQLVVLTVPFDYGMTQANELTAQIIEIDGSDFSLNVNSTNFDPFVVPSDGEQPASLTSGGSRNTYNYTSLPFHSLTNTGN